MASRALIKKPNLDEILIFSNGKSFSDTVLHFDTKGYRIASLPEIALLVEENSPVMNHLTCVMDSTGYSLATSTAVDNLTWAHALVIAYDVTEMRYSASEFLPSQPGDPVYAGNEPLSLTHVGRFTETLRGVRRETIRQELKLSDDSCSPTYSKLLYGEGVTPIDSLQVFPAALPELGTGPRWAYLRQDGKSNRKSNELYFAVGVKRT